MRGGGEPPAGDTDEEVELVKKLALEAGAYGAEQNDGFSQGEGRCRPGRGGVDAWQPNDQMIYDDDDSIEEKICKVARKVYGAKDVVFYLDARRKMKQYHDDGLDKLPICMAKTHLSLSSDPTLLNAPGGLLVPGARHPRVHREPAGWCRPSRRHPADAGLGKSPAALNVDIDAEGRTVGLFWA